MILRAALAVAGALAVAHPALAATRCPTETFLSFDHLAYLAQRVPPTVHVAPGRRLGSGAVDAPASADGCKRTRQPVEVVAAGAIEPRVAVLTRGRPRTVFVIGRRCAGSASYWDCLLRPLAFRGRRFTATRVSTVALGATIGTGELDGRAVGVRRLEGVDPALAVGVSGRPHEAFLTAATCPYEELDDLRRCLRSPVWFTFDPPGGKPGATVVARSDRRPGRAVAGAPIALARLPRVGDFVPKGRRVRVGRVGGRVGLRVPDVPAGLYEAVVTKGGALFPAGSILVTTGPKTSTGIRVVSYALTVVFAAAVLTTFWIWRRRRRLRGARGSDPG